MCFAARRVFYIKVLKDLDNETARFSIDIKVLKDLKTMRPKKNAGLDDREGQALALR